MPEQSDDAKEQALAAYEVQVDVAAVRVLPWDTGTPVASHMAAEGIQ